MIEKIFKFIVAMVVMSFTAGAISVTYGGYDDRITRLEGDHDTLIRIGQRVDDIAEYLHAPRRN